MEIKAFSDRVLLPDRKDVLRHHLYLKLLQFGIRPYENDIDIILELYMFGGYNNIDEQLKFIELCLEKGLRKSPQSVRNTFSKYINMGVFEKPKNTVLRVSDKFIPKVKCDKLALTHTVTHAE